MVYLFVALAILSFIAFALQARLKNGHAMVYAAACFAGWVLAALWWAGKF